MGISWVNGWDKANKKQSNGQQSQRAQSSSRAADRRSQSRGAEKHRTLQSDEEYGNTYTVDSDRPPHGLNCRCPSCRKGLRPETKPCQRHFYHGPDCTCRKCTI